MRSDSSILIDAVASQLFHGRCRPLPSPRPRRAQATGGGILLVGFFRLVLASV